VPLNLAVRHFAFEWGQPSGNHEIKAPSRGRPALEIGLEELYSRIQEQEFDIHLAHDYTVGNH